MDFTLNETEQAVSNLAQQILTDKVSTESLLEMDQAIESDDGEWFARDAYSELAKAGLVGVAVSAARGGGGADLVSLGQVLRAQGCTVAPMPLLNNSLASMAVDKYDTAGVHDALLAKIIDGDATVAIAIQEYLNDDVAAPMTLLDGDTLSGTKIVVEFFEDASALLVAATNSAGKPVLVLVDPASDGVKSTPGRSTRLQPVHEVEFEAVPATLLSDDADCIHWLQDHLITALCATQLGVTESALAMTAAYTSEREQFGRPIATFQAVTQRLADQYINVEGIRLTTANALWRLANDEPASVEVRVAKYWASERAVAIAHATQHCHGGTGVSVEYPLHRYTLWNKHLATSLGAGNQTLRELGALLAS